MTLGGANQLDGSPASQPASQPVKPDSHVHPTFTSTQATYHCRHPILSDSNPHHLAFIPTSHAIPLHTAQSHPHLSPSDPTSSNPIISSSIN